MRVVANGKEDSENQRIKEKQITITACRMFMVVIRIKSRIAHVTFSIFCCLRFCLTIIYAVFVAA